jgi:hypothetical protein
MAPEQAYALDPDPRTDLFALGVMVYEMLAGRHPFEGTSMEIVIANATQDPPAICERSPGIDADPLLESFARKLMARKVRDRFQSAGEALDVLAMIARLSRDREEAERRMDIRKATTALQDRLAVPRADRLPAREPRAPRRAKSSGGLSLSGHGAHAPAGHHHGHAHARPRAHASAVAPIATHATQVHTKEQHVELGLAATAPDHLPAHSRSVRALARGSNHHTFHARRTPALPGKRPRAALFAAAAVVLLAIGMLLGWRLVASSQPVHAQPKPAPVSAT